MADDDDAPHLPEPLAALWGRRETPRRGPRPGLTLDQIVAAGIALADADGLAGVSMARVAERLGVTTMALYRYVASKDNLLALMADAAVGEARVPEPRGDPDGVAWRESLEVWCRVQLELTRAHPWVVGLISTSPALGPNRVWWLETGLRALSGTPLSVGERTEVIGRLSLNLLSEATLLAAIEEMDHGLPAKVTHPALFDYGGLLRLLADPATHPQITAALEAGVFDPDPNEEYDVDFGLRLMLDGVAALIERASRRR